MLLTMKKLCLTILLALPLGAGAADDDHRLDDLAGFVLQRRVDIGLERHPLAAAPPAIGGDNHA